MAHSTKAYSTAILLPMHTWKHSTNVNPFLYMTYTVSRANITEVKIDPVTNENEAYGKLKEAASPTDDSYDYIATDLVTENPAYDRTVGGGVHHHENEGEEVTMGANEAYIATRQTAAGEEGEDNYDYVATGLEYTVAM